MIRRISDFLRILIFVWVCMLVGLAMINWLIVPMKLPAPFDGGMTNVVQVAISAGLVIIWLFLWRWIATRMFWRALGNDQNK